MPDPVTCNVPSNLRKPLEDPCSFKPGHEGLHEWALTLGVKPSWLQRLPRMLDDYWQVRSPDFATSRLTYSEAKQPFLQMAGLADARMASLRNMQQPMNRLHEAIKVFNQTEDPDLQMEAQIELYEAAREVSLRW